MLTPEIDAALKEIEDFCPCCDYHLEIVTEGVADACATLRAALEADDAEMTRLARSLTIKQREITSLREENKSLREVVEYAKSQSAEMTLMRAVCEDAERFLDANPELNGAGPLRGTFAAWRSR